ncbi:lipid A deacylase LpxR family protein [Mucilaginibacter corticis]|uniref:Lipid A deacylase LpxR family protein n=1 Tax=Mucilaginibacter corticis TaxID=2597670 RepID=A0A556MFA0_9SPHI|nr:lipid A deacylase LpxR family protein [Mucilaginibacter corticis]TSJ38587.1 lipid A deacylase LpxR family protein [Mucilaginibacter corticis]
MKKLFLPLLLIFSTTCALAQNHSEEFGIQSDNDSYLGQGNDRYYTDGLYFFFKHALDVKGSATLQNKVLGFDLGQKIFNPQSGSVPSADFVDRPFAGFLYAGANMNYLYKNESNLKIGAQVAIVGPASGGEAAQNFVHNNFGFYKTSGWQYQIKNDVELNLSGEYNKLIGRDSLVDLSFTSYGNLGTGITGAGAGLLFRIGLFNQLFNSASTGSSVIAGNAVLAHKHEFFFYYRPTANFVGYDATIQGGLFSKHNDPNSLEITGTPQRFVLSNQVGFTYSTSRWLFDATAIFHSKDTKEMAHADQWGSATVYYKFN